MQTLAILFYDYVPDILERRDPFREQHLRLLRELHAQDQCVMGGAIGDPPHGGVIVFRDADAARAFTDADPYVANGLVTAQRIEPWTVAIG